jgi:hypothetical protein
VPVYEVCASCGRLADNSSEMWSEIYHGIVRRTKAWRVATSVSKTTQITIETSSVLIIRRTRSSRARCPECAREVDHVGLAEAGVLTGMARPALRGDVETLKWHYSESSEGAPLVCLNSLMKSMQSENQWKEGE